MATHRFRRNVVCVRQVLVNGRLETPQNDYIVRNVAISTPVRDALIEQYHALREISDFVFCWPNGRGVDHNAVNRYVWGPTLRKAGLRYRPAYQTHHTAAVLFLQAGETLDWVASQLGQRNTEQVVERYRDYIPHNRGSGGAAFDNLLAQKGVV